MTCNKCGFKFKDKSKFCPNCGTAVDTQNDSKLKNTQSSKQNNNKTTNKLKASFKKHKPIYFLVVMSILLFIIAAVLHGFPHNNHNKNDSIISEQKTSYQTIIKVNSEVNIMFSTYNIEIYVDDEKLGVIKNGDSSTFELKLEEGEHVLEVHSAKDSFVKGTKSFNINKDSKIQFRLYSKNDVIEIEEEPYEVETTSENIADNENDKETILTEDSSTKVDSVSYSTNDSETVKEGKTGVYAYKSKKSPNYDVYWIIDFDEGFVYYFTNGNDEDETYDRLKITSGTLNDRMTITWNVDEEETDWYMHFKYKNIPTTLVVNDHLGLTVEFWTTDLDQALEMLDKRTINKY